MKVKVTLMSAVEPEIRRATLENNPDFINFKQKALQLFGAIDTEFLFQWKGKILNFSSKIYLKLKLEHEKKSYFTIFYNILKLPCR